MNGLIEITMGGEVRTLKFGNYALMSYNVLTATNAGETKQLDIDYQMIPPCTATATYIAPEPLAYILDIKNIQTASATTSFFNALAENNGNNAYKIIDNVNT